MSEEEIVEHIKHHIPIIIKFDDDSWCNANVYLENGVLVVKPYYEVLFED